jgi:hypothetical protein
MPVPHDSVIRWGNALGDTKQALTRGLVTKAELADVENALYLNFGLIVREPLKISTYG